jgi:membrane protein YdbS with pleckstrin-like domain
VIHRSKVDAWLRIALLLPVAAGTGAAVLGIVGHQPLAFYIGLAALVFYGLLMAGLVLPLSYAIDPDGLRVRSGLMRIHVPWERLISVEPSSNPLSSPALSLERLAVAYRTPGGGQTRVLISPVDRAAFVAELAKTSPRHRQDGDRLVEA